MPGRAAAGFEFALRRPNKGNNNAVWRRSGKRTGLLRVVGER
jgi:hypothetical protein